MLTMNGAEIEFSDGFTDLHTRIYEDVLRGGGFSLEDNRVAIETVGSIRAQEPRMPVSDYHPFLHNLKK
jgi:UDP-N-acetyl-2-amino-2-deoxyglucuronate dehydrogenase